MTASSLLLVQVLHGLVQGMLIFLVASGLTLIFGMLRILNMAHTSFYMLGAFFAYSVVARSGNFWLAIAVVPLAVGAIGIVVERFLLRPIARRGHTAELLLTFGIFYIVNELVLLLWGAHALQVPFPRQLAGSIPMFEGAYPTYRLFVLGLAAVIGAAMAFLLMYTRYGIVIRSTVSDPGMVASLGIDTGLVRGAVFGAGTALAALSGVIAAPMLQADPAMGAVFLVDSFIVVIVGGFGSLPGAALAALLLGQISALGMAFLPDFSVALKYLLLIGVLVLRPQGLFGEKG